MIYSPSYKRAETCRTHLLIPEIQYVVMESEAESYKKRGLNVIEIPDAVQGNVARVRNWILKNLIKDKGVIIDDDIEKFKRWTIRDGNPLAVDILDMEEFIEQGFVLCEESGCRLWGMNIIGDKGSYREYTPFSFNNWISGSFMGFLNNELSFDERLPLKEDYDFSIQNANKYRKLLRLNYAFMIKKDHGNLGGCADMRTVEKEKEQFDLFQKKWGESIVKADTTEKKNGKKIKSYDINPIIKIPIKGV